MSSHRTSTLRDYPTTRDVSVDEEMPRTSSSRPEYHAFAALYPAIGSAVQGSGPTAGDALAEAERGLGSAAGLETYRVGPRLAAVLALGTYDPTTPLVIERGLDLPEPRVELRLPGYFSPADTSIRIHM